MKQVYYKFKYLSRGEIKKLKIIGRLVFYAYEEESLSGRGGTSLGAVFAS